MSPQAEDEIVVRKKRRRTAVDLCLGYYGPSGDVTSATISGVPQVLVPGTSSPVVRYEENGSQNSPSSDSMMITVEGFLRQQAMSSSPKHCKMAYSRKKRRTATRRIHLSSSDVYSQSCAGDSPSDDPESSSPVACIHRPARKAKLKKASLPSRSTRKVQNKTGLTSRFSKRMQRAAVLSHVDQEVQADSLDIVPLPLSLVPFDTYLTPSSPLKSRRSKLVDPHLPRQLDSTFSNNENIISTTKPYMPFLRWGPSRTLATGDLPKTLPRVNRKRLPAHPPEGSSTLTPLELVPHEAHSEGRSIKFNRNKSSLFGINYVVHEDVCTNEEGLFSMELCDEPVENAPVRPTDIHPSITQNKPSEGTNGSLRRAYTVDPGLSTKLPSALPAPTFSRNLSLFASHPEHHRSHPADKPMHGIGTLLDSLMETARGVLVSQSQSQSQRNSDKSAVDHHRKSKPRPRPSKTILPRQTISPDELSTATMRGQVDRCGESEMPLKLSFAWRVLLPSLRRVPSQSYGYALKTADNFTTIDNLRSGPPIHKNTDAFISNTELTFDPQTNLSDLLNENAENTESHSPRLLSSTKSMTT
ncbi:hypothetical protein M0805_004344 [Coniferiporia weirii]|nr:hypothetical protein M0805_004344 [Coniferiporia weirii]